MFSGIDLVRAVFRGLAPLFVVVQNSVGEVLGAELRLALVLVGAESKVGSEVVKSKCWL